MAATPLSLETHLLQSMDEVQPPGKDNRDWKSVRAVMKRFDFNFHPSQHFAPAMKPSRDVHYPITTIVMGSPS